MFSYRNGCADPGLLKSFGYKIGYFVRYSGKFQDSSSFESRGKVSLHVLVDREAWFTEKYRAKAEGDI